MKFTVLGNGSATPIIERRPSASVLEIGNENILIDCGEGTQYQILKYKIKLSKINFILITHLHGDHYFGLIALINTINFIGRKEPLTIIGPKGLDEIIGIQMKYANAFLNFPINYIKTNPDNKELVFENHKFKIYTIPLKHRIPCTGFIIQEQLAKRKILADKIPDEFPHEYYRYLQQGLNITVGGKQYFNKDYTSDPLPPKKVAYCSDTIYDESLISHLEGSDLLYHEATFLHELIERADLTFHTTAFQAATLAKKAAVKKLIIGHFSSRYKILNPLRDEAVSVFENTLLAEEGKVYPI